MRISDWSSDVCSSDLDRPHVVQAHLVGEQDKAWSIICKCGAAMQRNARKTARTMTPSSSHLLAQVCTAELVTCLRCGDGSNRTEGRNCDARSEARRVGKGCVGTCTSWWWPYP